MAYARGRILPAAGATTHQPSTMTLLLWTAIGIAVGHAIAGRPLVIFYVFGAVAIDMRPFWRSVGAVVAVAGGLITSQLVGSAPAPSSPDILDVAPALTAAAAVVLVRGIASLVDVLDSMGRAKTPAWHDRRDARSAP